jgi:hypothetical protein
MVKRRSVLKVVGASSLATITAPGTVLADGAKDQDSKRTVNDVRVTNDRSEPVDIKIVASSGSGNGYRTEFTVGGFGSKNNVAAFDVPAEVFETLQVETSAGDSERVELLTKETGVPEWRGYRFAIRPTGDIRVSQVEV